MLGLFNVLAYNKHYEYSYQANIGNAAVLGVGSLVFLIVMIGISVYFMYKLYKLGIAMGYENPWFAFVPVLNTIMIFQLGDYSPAWVLTFFIPIINMFVPAIILILALRKIAEKNGRNPNNAFLILVPVANFFIVDFLMPKELDENGKAITSKETEDKKDEIDKILE